MVYNEGPETVWIIPHKSQISEKKLFMMNPGHRARFMSADGLTPTEPWSEVHAVSLGKLRTETTEMRPFHNDRSSINYYAKEKKVRWQRSTVCAEFYYMSHFSKTWMKGAVQHDKNLIWTLFSTIDLIHAGQTARDVWCVSNMDRKIWSGTFLPALWRQPEWK